MAKLVINPGSPAAWEVQLKPGANSLGRAPANDFQITDPSVSGSHCQILLENGNAVIKDLGSTNGTFVNRAPVKEAVLQPGQTIHLGGVEMAFHGDGPAAVAFVGVAQAVAPGAPRPATAVPVPRASTAAPVARIAGLPPGVRAGRLRRWRGLRRQPRTPRRPSWPRSRRWQARRSSAPISRASSIPRRRRATTALIASDTSASSASLRGRSGASSTRPAANAPAELAPVQVAAGGSSGQERFFSKLPGVFAYPFKGSGPFVLDREHGRDRGAGLHQRRVRLLHAGAVLRLPVRVHAEHHPLDRFRRRGAARMACVGRRRRLRVCACWAAL